MIFIETCPVCGQELMDTVVATNDALRVKPRKECSNCGWYWEGAAEEVMRVPFGGNAYASNRTDYILERYMPMQPSDAAFDSSPCKNCSNNSKNGGSGICHCILGQQKMFW